MYCRTLLNTFFISKVNYCPLKWMCHCRAKSNKINRHHERHVRIIYNDKIPTFKQLLRKDSSVSIDTRNFWFLAVKIFKVLKGLAPKIFSDLFSLKEQIHYSLRRKSFFKTRRTKIWETLSQEIQ